MKRLVALAALFIGSLATAQTVPRGWEISALPATNFSSDEGFGYGVTAQAFQYGDGLLKPYRYTIQPLVLFTTKGRRDISINFDAPHVLPHGWRVTGLVGREQLLAMPYYGQGISAPYDSTKEASPNPYYYRYGRTTLRAKADFQRAIRGPLHLLVGAGVQSLTIDKSPFDSGTTLIAEETGAGSVKVSAQTVRAGLVYDTRDRETGPTSGQWVDLLTQHNSSGYTRTTLTARSYIGLGSRVVWAHRVLAQNIGGITQFYDLPAIQGSYRDDEALGGAGSVRGLPKNRYIGKGIIFANEELRWRAADFRVRGRESALILSGFFDAGRVYEGGLTSWQGDWLARLLSFKPIVEGFQSGAGVGTRLAYGQNFVVALDAARSNQGTGVYIGLGYPF